MLTETSITIEQETNNNIEGIWKKYFRHATLGSLLFSLSGAATTIPLALFGDYESFEDSISKTNLLLYGIFGPAAFGAAGGLIWSWIKNHHQVENSDTDSFTISQGSLDDEFTDSPPSYESLFEDGLPPFETAMAEFPQST